MELIILTIFTIKAQFKKVFYITSYINQPNMLI